MITLDHLRTTLAGYLKVFPEEEGRLQALLGALDGDQAVASRRAFDPGHVTCSAVVVDPDLRVLHVEHRDLGIWLNPGGHLEPDDESLIAGAMREAREEAAVPIRSLTPWPGFETVPLDVDVHNIAPNSKRGEPAHQHFDFRWAFTVKVRPAVSLQEEEVTGYAWRRVAQMEEGLLREKLEKLLAA